MLPRTHDLSPPKCLIYLRSFFRFGFAVRFLFVTWRVLARLELPTVGHPSAVAYASCSFLMSHPSGMMTPKEVPELNTGDSHPTRSRPCWAYCNGAGLAGDFEMVDSTLPARSRVTLKLILVLRCRVEYSLGWGVVVARLRAWKRRDGILANGLQDSPQSCFTRSSRVTMISIATANRE